MPRDPGLVTAELASFACGLPQENLDGLAFLLMPDEVIRIAVLGRGERSQDKGSGYGEEKIYQKYDEVLLLLTDWRILERSYQHDRNGRWQRRTSWSMLWQRIEEFSGWENEGTRWINAYLGYSADVYVRNHFWRYPSAVIDDKHFRDFINVGQERVQRAWKI